MSAIITLLTDFGTVDGYVAEMKGVLLSLVPGARVVDLTHEIPPGDIRAGAYALGRAWRAFPDGTVHLAVVDPGVGTARRALAAEVGGQRFVAPDNGLLSRVFEGRPCARTRRRPSTAGTSSRPPPLRSPAARPSRPP
jgi:S-adenosylmethionine hydrolase